MTNVLLEIFFANRDTSVELEVHSVSLSFVSPYDVIEHRHEDNSSLEFFWFTHFAHELLDFTDKLQCGGSLEIFQSNSIGSPSIVSKALFCDESLNQLNISSQTAFDVGFSLTFSKAWHRNLKIREPSRAKD